MGKDPLQDFVEALIRSWDLLDIKPVSGRFTWNNNRTGSASILARLDRFFVQSSLLDSNLIISSKLLPKTSSDHHPISLLVKEEEDYGPIPFHFSPMWIECQGFLETMSEVWMQYVDGSPSFVWEQKL